MNLRRLFSLLLASRFWLVLALAPYLFLGAAGESLHNHPLPSQTAICVSANSRAKKTSTIGAQHTFSSAIGSCLTCLWQSQSQAQIAAAPLQLRQLHLQNIAFFGVFKTHVLSWLALASTRGPPQA